MKDVEIDCRGTGYYYRCCEDETNHFVLVRGCEMSTIVWVVWSLGVSC